MASATTGCAIGALVVALIVAACDGPKKGPADVGQQYVALKSIRAGGIEFSPDGYNGKYFAIKGKFKVTDEGTDAIESDGIAGACLFADLNPRLPIMSNPGRTCSRNADCQGGLPPTWFGECNKKERKCYVRPGPPYSRYLCNKSFFYPSPRKWPVGEWQDSNVYYFDVSHPLYGPGPDGSPLIVPAPAFMDTVPGRVQWRVVACLNGLFDPFPPKNEDPPCTQEDSKNKIVDWGPPTWVPLDLQPPPAKVPWPRPNPH
jgi:hypothetical protein